jgi:hypothetical protein
MLPLRSRRRSRRRSFSRRFAFLIVALVLIALVIGGLARVSEQSNSFDSALNRSFVAQGSLVAQESNQTARTVHRLLTGLHTQIRQTLQADLDAVVQQADDESGRAAAVTTPAAPGGGPAAFATVFAERANAVRSIRSAIDGVLGMSPFPVVGAASGSTSDAVTPTLLSSYAATGRLSSAGSLLTKADATYRSLRRSLAKQPGHAHLPASTWVTSQQLWDSVTVQNEVTQLTSLPLLAGSHRLVLGTMLLTPAALPSSTGTPIAGQSTLSPTTSLSISVVVLNQGSSNEPHATVRFTLTESTTGDIRTETRSGPVEVGQSVAVPSATFSVKPGHGYQLTVSLVLPAGQSITTGTSVTQQLTIAPATG